MATGKEGNYAPDKKRGFHTLMLKGARNKFDTFFLQSTKLQSKDKPKDLTPEKYTIGQQKILVQQGMLAPAKTYP